MMSDDKLATVEAAPLDRPDSFLSFLERASKDPEFSVQKFEVIMAAKERADDQERKRLYAVDMNGLQSEIGAIVKGGTNDHTRSKYIRLDDMLVQLQPLLEKFGFAVGFDCAPIQNTALLDFSCTFTHRAGHSETKHLPLPIDGKGAKGGHSSMNEIQSVGSTTTYARRYLLDMHLNIARKGEDDDGNGGPACVTEAQAKQIADKLALAPDAGKFWRFMSLGMVKPISTPGEVLARDFRRAMEFFQAAARVGK
jgi:hypothetical protein